MWEGRGIAVVCLSTNRKNNHHCSRVKAIREVNKLNSYIYTILDRKISNSSLQMFNQYEQALF